MKDLQKCQTQSTPKRLTHQSGILPHQEEFLLRKRQLCMAPEINAKHLNHPPENILMLCPKSQFTQLDPEGQLTRKLLSFLSNGSEFKCLVNCCITFSETFTKNQKTLQNG